MPDIFDTLSPDEVSGGDIFDTLAPESKPLDESALKRALRAQQPSAASQFGDRPGERDTAFTVALAKDLPSDIGTALHKVGSGIYEEGVRAAQKDIENILGVPEQTPEVLNTAEAIRTYPKPVQAVIQGVKGVVESAPQLAIAAVNPAAGALAFGMTPEGFDPKQAALAAALPVIGKWSGAIVETMAAKAGVTADQALLAWNKLGGATGAAGAIGADQAIAISQLPPEQREQAWIDAAGNVGSMFILGTLSEHKRPNVERIVEPNRQRAAFVENLPGEGKPVNVEATVKPVATESRPTAAPKDIFDEVSPDPISQSQSPESSQNSGLKAGNKNTPAAVSATSPDAGASSPAGSPKLVSGALQAAQATDAPPTVPKTKDEHILQATESLAKAAADLQAAIRGNQLAPQKTKPAVSEANLETLKGGESNGQEIQGQRQGQEVLADRPSGETVTAAGGQSTLQPAKQYEPNIQTNPTDSTPGNGQKVAQTQVLPQTPQGNAPSAVGNVAQQSQEFDRLVKDYGPQAGWATGDEGVYNNQLQTGENLSSGIAAKVHASRQMQALRRAALSHAVPPDQRNNYDLETPEGRAKALPVLEAHLRQQFPADNTIAKRRALQQFGSSEPQALTPSQQRAGLKQDGDELRRIAAENPGGAEFRNLVVHSTAGRGASAGSPGQLGGNGGRKSRITAAEQKALRELDRIHGTRTIIVDSPGELPFNGFKDRNSNVILIHARADKPVLVVAGHELLHHIRLTNPALYEETAAQLWPLLQNTGDFRLRLERRGQGKADAVEELLADFVGDNFGRKEFWDDLRKREPNLFRRLAKLVKEWLDKLIAKLKVEKPKTFESEQYFSDLEQARNVVTNALIQAGRETQYRAAGIEADAGQSATETQSGDYSKPEKPLMKMTREQFDRKYVIHFDVRDGATDRVESIMRDGLRSGMVSSDIDNQTSESIFGKYAMARGWARFASADKPGAIAYVIRNGDFNKDSLRIKPGTKPVAVVRLTRENQSVYEALQEQGGPLFSKPEGGDLRVQIYGRIKGTTEAFPISDLDDATRRYSLAKVKSKPRTDVPEMELITKSGNVVGSIKRDGKVYDADGGLVYDPFAEDTPGAFSKPDGGDLFGAPESVEEQRARLKAESETQKLKKAKEQMQERAAARLVSTEDTRTQDMFGTPEHRTTRMTSEGQGSLFSKPEKQFPERFALAHPIKGQNGAAIVGYEWRSTMGEKYSAREGGMVDARVSDWDNADESTGTGRAIVHVFYVQHPNGTVKPEGIRSAQNVLGISETRLMTIAKKERAAQQYREDQERAEMDNYEKAAVTTPQEAARNYRKWNYSPMRTFEQNDEIFNESALFEKAGKFIRRSWKTAARMQRNGWTLVKDDPARTGGTTKAIDAIRPPESEKKSGGGLPQEITDAVNEWRGAEKRYRRARRQEPTDVGDAEEARQEAEINFRVLAEKHNITQAQFDDLIAEAKATDTEQMGDLEQGSLFSKPEKSIAELQGELKHAEQEMKAALRTAGDPKRSISSADAKQAVALATAKYREIEDAINQHPDRFKDKSVADLNARLDEIQTRLTEIEGQRKGAPLDTGKYEATGAKAADHQELISERWRLLKDRKAIDKAIVTRPEYAADVLKRSEALANDLRAAKARGDTTAARQAVEDLMALQEGELARIDPKLIEQVRADLVAKGELEALTPASARTLGDLTAWLKANKIESPGMSIKDRLNLAGRLAAEWTQGKTKLEAALAKSRAIWQAFKAQWRSPKTDDEVRSIFKEWHYEKQFSGLETHQWIQRIRADIPQKIRRNAISVWLDADGDKGLLTFQRDAVPEQYRAVWQTALNLTPSEQAFARQIKADFASKLADGQLLGLIGKGRQDYGVPQVWAKPPEHGENYNPEASAKRAARNPLAKLDPRDPFFALERTHDSYFDGIMAGGVPKSLDISDLVGVYNVDFHGALADRSVIKALKDAKMPDGSPAVMMSGGAKIEVNATGRTQFVDSNWRPKDAVTEDGRPYQTIDHWALRSWTFGAKDTAGNPIMVKGDFLVHPDLYRDLKTQLEGKSALRDPDGPLGDIAHLTKFMLESGAYLKASKFAAATFHGATLAEHMMTHAFSGKPSPERLGLLNPWVGGVEIDPAKNVELANLMRHGMDLGFGGSRMLFEEGLSSHGGILSKVPGLGDGLAWLSNGLFQEYLPRLKVKMGSVLLHANMARYSKKSASGPALTEQQIYELTASQVNAAFGGQNWKLMGRSKTFLDVNRLLFTAPDFLLSRAKVVGQAGKPYHAEQRYFLLAQAALVYAAARILNYLLDDGDPHWEAENALRVIHKGRAYSARFIVNDIGHLLQDPAGFAGGRLGPWPKALYETVTGRDMRSGARIEVPFKTENGALNAAQILIKDLAMWGLPIGTEGFLPGATGREQTTLGQFGVGLLGVGSQRYTPETEMYQLAAEFNRKSPDPKTQLHQQTRDDAVKETSVYRKLDVLLEAGDFKAARKEYDALIAEGHTVIGIKQRYNATTGDHLARPFSGSVEREKKFKTSLTPEQLQEYNRAVQMRKEREKAFKAMLQSAR